MTGLADPHNSPERPFCDAVISIHGVQFEVHKYILYGCSPYFRCLLLHSAPDRKEFEVPELSAATMKLIIDFAYTGSVSVTEDNVQELLQAADQFIITGIKQACCNFLLERLSSENCIGIWQLCDICVCPELQQKAYRYLLTHFEEVLFRKEFQQLSLQELFDILDCDELNVRREETLCRAIFNWVDYEPAERQQHLAVLLSKVRLALTSQCVITDLMNTGPVSMEILQQAQKLQTDMSVLRPSLSVCSHLAARPRLPNTILFAIGGLNIRNNLTNVYDFQADRWNAVSEHGAYPYAYHGTVHCNGFIYCVGGLTENVMHRLDLTTHTWHEVAPMHHWRCTLTVTVLGGCIYAMGGFGVKQPHRSAECYNPQTNQWKFIAPMHELRAGASCTSLHNMIYICGGYNGSHLLDTCECYSPKTNQWTMLTSMSNQRVEHGFIAYEDLIFAVGGTDSNETLKSVEAYDPKTDKWQAVSSMLLPRSSFGIAVIDNKLFVIGGHNGKVQIGKVEYYDMSTCLWSEACQMEVRRCGLSCCVVSGLPNVAEYVISRDNL